MEPLTRSLLHSVERLISLHHQPGDEPAAPLPERSQCVGCRGEACVGRSWMLWSDSEKLGACGPAAGPTMHCGGCVRAERRRENPGIKWMYEQDAALAATSWYIQICTLASLGMRFIPLSQLMWSR